MYLKGPEKDCCISPLIGEMLKSGNSDCSYSRKKVVTKLRERTTVLLICGILESEVN